MSDAMIVALIGFLGTVLTGYLVYRRGAKDIEARSAAERAQRDATQATTAVQGFSDLTTFLQSEVRRLSVEIAECRADCAAKQEAIDELTAHDKKNQALVTKLTTEVRRIGGNV